MAISAERERFERLASKRTQAVLDKLDILANCANRQNYDYTEEDVAKIFDAIEHKIENVKAEFRAETHKGQQEEFNL